MKFNPYNHARKSNRLSSYDYSQSGLFFITICVQGQECLLGEIHNKIMVLNDTGKIADKFWKEISTKYQQTKLHNHIIMPNHIHGIIEIAKEIQELPVQGSDTHKLSEQNLHQNPKSNSGTSSYMDQRRKMLLSKIIGWYKMNSSKNINIINRSSAVTFWQRNYYDHIIRTEESYLKISDYIINNPSKWQDDKFYC